MFATANYTPVRKGRYYKIMGKGFDYYMIRWNGRCMYVPKWVFEKRGKEDKTEQEQLEQFEEESYLFQE